MKSLNQDPGIHFFQFIYLTAILPKQLELTINQIILEQKSMQPPHHQSSSSIKASIASGYKLKVPD